MYSTTLSTFLLASLAFHVALSHPIDETTTADPLADAAEALSGALNAFIDVKGEQLMGVVDGHVEEIHEEVEENAEQLRLIEQEVENLSQTGSIVGCRGVRHHGYCYFLVNQRYSMESAARSCVRSEAELAALDGQDYMDAVHDYVIHTDQVTDKSMIFVWTSMVVDDIARDVLTNTDNWLPGFPLSDNPDATHVMWQIMSDDFFLYHDGFLNAPPDATAYPLCRTYVLDIDECVTTPDICGTGGTCTDTDGSYTCACAAGYTGGGAATACTAVVHFKVGPVVDQDATFEQAQQLCLSMDSLSHMASIKTTEQMEAVLQLLEDYQQSQGWSGQAIAAFLGGTYNPSSNTITYLDGEVFVVPSGWWRNSYPGNYAGYTKPGVMYGSSSMGNYGMVNFPHYGIASHNHVLCQK